MTRVEYRQSDQRAVFSGEADPRVYRESRSAVGSRAPDLIDEGPTAFSTPWVQFLPIRSQVRSAILQAGGELVLGVAARKQLAIVSSFERALDAPITHLGEGELESKLTLAGFTRKLLPYQLRNVQRMLALPVAADYSVPGAGKTTEALAYYQLRRRADSVLLVVCPKNAFPAWEEQLAECMGAGVHFVRLVGGADRIGSLLDTEPAYTLISYRQLVEVQLAIANFLSRMDAFVFLDESHHIKLGRRGITGQTVLSLAHLPKGRLVMSGTPMPQSVDDLVPQVQFLRPSSPVSADNVVSDLRRLFVRTTKDDLKLPPVVRATRQVPMSPAQSELYRLAVSEAERTGSGLLTRGDRAQLRTFGRSVIRLLQIASNPMLLPRTEDALSTHIQALGGDQLSPKIEYVCNRARELSGLGRKVIIWSMFVRNVELVAARLEDLGADFIHGGVEAGSEEEEETREAKVKRFKTDSTARVLVANPAACSEGISLHMVCHDAIYLDRSFNAAQFIQSEERIHRIGLKSDQMTRIEIVQSPGTIDDIVQNRLEAKIAAMAAVLGDRSLSAQTVLDLDPEDDSLDREDITAIMNHVGARA